MCCMKRPYLCHFVLIMIRLFEVFFMFLLAAHFNRKTFANNTHNIGPRKHHILLQDQKIFELNLC